MCGHPPPFAQRTAIAADTSSMSDPISTPPQRPTPAERRAPEKLLYSADQALGRSPIRLRRRSDKLRLAGHLAVVVALTALSIWWVIPPHTFSGRVMADVAQGRGVHIGDLAILVFGAIAGRSLRSALRLRRRR